MNRADNPDLFRLVYRSRSAVTGTAADMQRHIDQILTVSHHRNAHAEVTGAMMFTGLFFVQALEGPAAAVEATFERICCDLRHSNVEVVECGPVLEPAFGDWSMRHLVPAEDTEGLVSRIERETEFADAAVAAMKLMLALIKSHPPSIEPAQRLAV